MAKHYFTKYTAASARRGAAEAERQRQLREQYGNWFLAHRAARLEREAAAKDSQGDASIDKSRQ